MLQPSLCVIVVGGNILILICFISSNKLREQKYALICSLASSDLLIGLTKVCTLLLIALGGSFGECMTYNQLGVLFSIEASIYSVSLLHLIMIGVDRFIEVMVPLRYASLITKNVVVALIIISWVIPLIYMIYAIILVLLKDKIRPRTCYFLITWIIRHFKYLKIIQGLTWNKYKVLSWSHFVL